METNIEVNNYYGVFIPPDQLKQLDAELNSSETVFPRIHVYTDQLEALKIVKKSKKARFKVFKTRSEAEEFALNGSEQVVSSPVDRESKSVLIAEKPTQFRGPTSQDLVKLRKMIEEGELDLFRKTIWDNPRYLISSGDTPSILKEGHRYNALHIATKALNAKMCELILETVSCPRFIQLLYGEDNLEICQERANILLDLYLNTPDKGLNETPLHFAVKYGAAECVEVLTSYTQCDKNLKNKYGEYAREVICQRCSSVDPVVRNRISALLEERFYVPVFRSDDGTSIPEIGSPFSPHSPPILNNDPLSPRVEIHAYAGPMKMTEAVEFRKKWKTPPRLLQQAALRRTKNSPIAAGVAASSPITYRYLSDPDKGLERLGRELAHEHHIGWKEYWPFLDTFIDLSNVDGLNLLEKYISKKYENAIAQISYSNEMIENSFPRKYTDYDSDTEENSESPKEIVSPMTDLCRAFKKCTLNDVYTLNRFNSEKHFDNMKNNKMLINNPNISPYLCVEKSLQVFATRIYNIIVNFILDNLDCLKVEIRHLISLVSSYQSDKRFSMVDFSVVHWKIAYLVSEKIYDEYIQTELDSFLQLLNYVIQTKEKLEPIEIFDQHIVCLLKLIVDCAKKIGEFENKHEKEFQFLNNNNTEEKCKQSWQIGLKCQCIWEIKAVNSNITTRKSINWMNKRNQNRFASMRSSDSDCSLSFFEPFKRHLGFGGSNSDSKSNDNDVLTDDSSLSSCESDSEDEMFYTPPQSPAGDDQHSDSDVEMLDVSDQGAIDVFLEGSYPTKTDANVYYALKTVTISEKDYPNIYRWRHTIQLYSDEDRDSWPTYCSARYSHVNVQTSPKCSTPRFNNVNNNINNLTAASISPTLSSPNYPGNVNGNNGGCISSPSWTRITGIDNSPLNSRGTTPPSSRRYLITNRRLNYDSK